MIQAHFRRHDLGLALLAGGLLGCGLAPLVHADPPPPGWSGQGQAGYMMSRGNSDADSGNAQLNINYVAGPWTHSLLLDGLYGKSAGVVSAERWEGMLQSNYAITDPLFAFGALDYQHDEFSGFVYQAVVSGGLGYKLIDTKTTGLSVQVGAGYRNLKPEELIKDPADGAVVQRIPGESSGEAVGTFGLNFQHQFNASTSIGDKFLMDAGSDNTYLRNDLALQVKMSQHFSLAVAYTLLDNTKPPPGLKKQDEITTLNLVYAFGPQTPACACAPPSPPPPPPPSDSQ